MQATETPILVAAARVACDGGVGVLGHPRIFLNIPPGGTLPCPYCGKLYHRGAAAAAAGH